MNTESQGDPSALPPEQEGGKVLGPDGLPVQKSLDGKAMPTNDESLTAVEILGRCSKCKVTGWIDYPGKKIPAKDIDKLLDYKPVKCFCSMCKSYVEFLPIAYRKYPDVPMLGNLQKSFSNGKIK